MSDNTYRPDLWVMLKVTTPTYSVYKILAGWQGGFATGDSWKLNSGCVSVRVDGDYFVFTGASGSEYQVHQHAYRLSMTTAAMLKSFRDGVQDTGVEIEMLPEDTDWLKLDYTNGGLQ